MLSVDYRYLLQTALEARPLWANLLTQANAVGYLLGHLWQFDRLNSDPQLPVIAHANAHAVLRLAAVGVGLVGGLALLRRCPAWSLGILWFAIWIAIPVVNGSVVASSGSLLPAIAAHAVFLVALNL